MLGELAMRDRPEDELSDPAADVGAIDLHIMSCIKTRGWLRRERDATILRAKPEGPSSPDQVEELERDLARRRPLMTPWIETLPVELDRQRLGIEGLAGADATTLEDRLAGVESALRELITRFEPKLHKIWRGIVRKYSGLGPGADDAEGPGLVWLKLQGNAPPDDPSLTKTFAAWCRAVLENEAKDRLRRRSDREVFEFRASERRSKKLDPPLIRPDEVATIDAAGNDRFREDPLSDHDLTVMEGWSKVVHRLIWPILELFWRRIPQDRWNGPGWVGHPDHAGARPLPSLEYWLEPDDRERHRLLARDLNMSSQQLTQHKYRSKAKLQYLKIANPVAWEDDHAPGSGGGEASS